MIRVFLCITLSIVPGSIVVAQNGRSSATPPNGIRNPQTQQRQLFVQLLTKEIDRVVTDARRKMVDDPRTAFADLKFAYENVKRSPELEPTDRKRLLGKLMEAGREAKRRMGSEERRHTGNSDINLGDEQERVASDSRNQPPKKTIREVLGVTPSRGVEIAYPYRYDGLLTQGTATFVFTVGPQRVSDDGKYVLVRLRNIRRLWNGQLKEANIRSMPFADPHGYKVFSAPANWGDTVTIGDTAWLDVATLRQGESDVGTTVDSGKADQMLELVAVGIAAGAAIHEVTKDSDATSGSEDKKIYLPGSLVTNRGIFRVWIGRVVSVDENTYEVRLTYPKERKGEVIAASHSQVKAVRFLSVPEVWNGARGH